MILISGSLFLTPGKWCTERSVRGIGGMALQGTTSVPIHGNSECHTNPYRFSKSDGDGAIARDVKVSQFAIKHYKVHVHTGNVRGAGTDANVFVTVFGKDVCWVIKWLSQTYVLAER